MYYNQHLFCSKKNNAFLTKFRYFKREKIGDRGSILIVNFYCKGYNQPKLLYINKY